MRVLIVEDEAIVARRLRRLTGEILGARMRLLEQADDLESARLWLSREDFDLVLLDLDLYGRDGFDLVRGGLAAGASVVVVSAHGDRALEGFDRGVVDFVAKPFDQKRLAVALERLLERRGGGGRSRLAVRLAGEVAFVAIDDLVFAEGAGDYSRLVLADGRSRLHEETLSGLERMLPRSFERIHRSYIVDLKRARRLRSLPGSRYRLILADGRELPVSRRRIRDVRRALVEL